MHSVFFSDKLAAYSVVALALIIGAGGQEAQAATLPVTANGVVWERSYNPNVLEDPTLYDKAADSADSSPYWSYASWAGTPTATVTDDYLRITSDPGSAMAFSQATTWDWSKGATIEARFRVFEVTGPNYAGSFLINTGKKYIDISFSESSLYGGTTWIPGLSLTDWTVLRFTLTGSAEDPTMKIYLNGTQDAIATIGSDQFAAFDSTSYIQFGDAVAAVDGYSGTMDWNYIRWTDTGAYAPVPEPSQFALAALGALAIGGFYRKNRSSKSGS